MWSITHTGSSQSLGTTEDEADSTSKYYDSRTNLLSRDTYLVNKAQDASRVLDALRHRIVNISYHAAVNVLRTVVRLVDV